MKVDDWEAVAVGACPGGSCIYIADIGDNEAERKRITIHRVPEPSNEDSVAVKDTFHATYPTAHTTRKPCSSLQTAASSS